MSSGNDAAIAIAEHVGGNVENFCNMMNEKAKELGAFNTCFTSPHGLDDENHYTTVEDLLIFSKELMKNPFFVKITNSTDEVIKINSYSKNIKSTNEMLDIYEGVNGIKTGFTNNAGRCLITSIESGDRNLITIVMGCDTRKQRTEESIKLINYGYNEFLEVDLFEKMIKSFEIRVEKSCNEKYILKINGNKKTILDKNDVNNLSYKYEFYRRVKAPLSKEEIVGKICILLDGDVIDELLIKLPEDIKRKATKEYFYDIMKLHKKLINLNI